MSRLFCAQVCHSAAIPGVIGASESITRLTVLEMESQEIVSTTLVRNVFPYAERYGRSLPRRPASPPLRTCEGFAANTSVAVCGFPAAGCDSPPSDSFEYRYAFFSPFCPLPLPVSPLSPSRWLWRYRPSPGGSVRGERANFTELVLGYIEADFCK